MRKISLVIFANVMGCTQLYASTYCGKVEATYFDKVDGGPGVVYELLLKNDQKNKHLTLNVFSKNTKEEKLKKSIMNLIDLESSYCFEGSLSGTTLDFDSVKLDEVE